MTVQVLPLGYVTGKYLSADENGLRRRLGSYFDVLEKASAAKEILLPSDHDQMPLQQDILGVMEKLREICPQRKFMVSRFEEVLGQIEAQHESLAILEGESIDGKYVRIHHTIGSTRMDVRVAHTHIENKIVNLLGPLVTLAWTLGSEYHHGLLEKMWKEILKNHVHSSIDCYCNDKVHREIVTHLELAEGMTNSLPCFHVHKIVDNVPQSNAGKFVLFNLIPWPREEVINTTVQLCASQFNLRDDHSRSIPYFIRHACEIDPGLIDQQIVHYGNYDPFMEFDIQINQIVPSMGCRTFYVEMDQPGNVITAKSDAEGVLEDAFWQIALSEDGMLQLVDEDSGVRHDRVLQIGESSDDSDEYDYSPIKEERVITSATARL